MKKIGVLLFLVLYLSLGFGVMAQAPPGVDDFGVGGTDDVDRFVNYSEQTQEFIEEEKYKLLADRWKEILLKNKFLSAVDGFFRKINFVFFILFGEDYDFTFNFLLLVVVWIIHLVFFNDVLGSFSMLSRSVTFFILVGFNIILAQIGYVGWIADLMFRFLFFNSGIWKWVGPGLAVLIFALVIVIGRFIKQHKEKDKEAIAKMVEKADRESLHDTVEAVRKGTS